MHCSWPLQTGVMLQFMNKHVTCASLATYRDIERRIIAKPSQSTLQAGQRKRLYRYSNQHAA